MTQQPARGPMPMPNPAAKAEQGFRELATTTRRVGALLLAELRTQTVLLHRMQEIMDDNKRALDAMQAGEVSEFSVKGLPQADAEDDSPFIGG